MKTHLVPMFYAAFFTSSWMELIVEQFWIVITIISLIHHQWMAVHVFVMLSTIHRRTKVTEGSAEAIENALPALSIQTTEK